MQLFVCVLGATGTQIVCLAIGVTLQLIGSAVGIAFFVAYFFEYEGLDGFPTMESCPFGDSASRVRFCACCVRIGTFYVHTCAWNNELETVLLRIHANLQRGSYDRVSY